MLFLPLLFSLHSTQQCNAFLAVRSIVSSAGCSLCRTNTLRASIGGNIPEEHHPTTIDAATNKYSPKHNKKEIRPMTQNWWPVTLTSSPDQSKPNPIVLLDQKLVLWYDSAKGQWSCLDDRCAHRFAPLSEGRIVFSSNAISSSSSAATSSGSSSSCLQCAYHGWEFNSCGNCTRIPQSSSNQKLCSVQSYPVREGAGMIWV